MMKALSVVLLSGIMGLGVNVFVFAAADVVINEWNDNGNDHNWSFIELYNAGSASQDLTGWQARYYNNAATSPTITISLSGSLAAGNYLIIARNATEFNAHYSPITADYSHGWFYLDSGNDWMDLYDGSSVVDQFTSSASEDDWTPNHCYERINYPNSGIDINNHWADIGVNKDGSPKAANDNSLPVTLSSFAAIPTDSEVTLKWRTESEVDNLGWDIYRSEKKDGKFVKINDGLIPGAGNSAMPNTYQFVDKTAIKGRQYYYYLEDVDMAGTRNKSSIITTSKDAGKLTTTWSKIKKG